MNKEGFYSKLPLEEKKKILKQCLVVVDKEQKEVIKKSKLL